MQPRLHEPVKKQLAQYASGVYPPASTRASAAHGAGGTRQRYVAVHVRQTDNLNAVGNLGFNRTYFGEAATYLRRARAVAVQLGISVVVVETDRVEVLRMLQAGEFSDTGVCARLHADDNRMTSRPTLTRLPCRGGGKGTRRLSSQGIRAAHADLARDGACRGATTTSDGCTTWTRFARSRGFTRR